MAKSSDTNGEEKNVDDKAIGAVEVAKDPVDPSVDAAAVKSDKETGGTQENVKRPAEARDDATKGATPADDRPQQPKDGGARPASAKPVQKKPSRRVMPLVLVLLLGGVAAFAFSNVYPSGDRSGSITAQLDAQADQIAALEARLAAMPDFNLSGVEARITDLAEETSAQVRAVTDVMAEQFGAIETRILSIEGQTGGTGGLSEDVLNAYQRDLEAMRADLVASNEAIMAAAAQTEVMLEEARLKTETLEQETRASAARAALNRVAASVESGAPFAVALSDLAAGNVPDVLVSAADLGVATTPELADDFPDAARAALGAARAAGLSDDAGGIGGFFRTQLDVRSTTPREGSDPDAILSRAEAAVQEGQIASALGELDALPDVARAEMADWIARAQQRADVLAAIATLSNTNN